MRHGRSAVTPGTAGDVARRLVLVRALTFGYIAAWLTVRAGYVWGVANQPARRFEPVGIVGLLGAPPHRAVTMTVAVTTLVAAVLAATGRLLWVSAPVAALGMLGVASLVSSFGQIFHTEHLVVLHAGVLAAHAVGTARGRGSREWADRWALTMLAAVTAVTYVVAGVAKLRASGIEWVAGDVLRNWVAVDNLRKLLLVDPYSPLGGWLAGIDWIWPPVALATLALELGAPIVLLGRRPAVAWALGAWLFHVGVLAVMAISFPYQLTGVAYAALVPVERVEAWARAALARRRPYTRSTCGSSC